MRYGAWRCLKNDFEISNFRTEIYTERRTAHIYIHIEKISIDITSVGLASARPNYTCTIITYMHTHVPDHAIMYMYMYIHVIYYYTCTCTHACICICTCTCTCERSALHGYIHVINMSIMQNGTHELVW